MANFVRGLLYRAQFNSRIYLRFRTYPLQELLTRRSQTRSISISKLLGLNWPPENPFFPIFSINKSGSIRFLLPSGMSSMKTMQPLCHKRLELQCGQSILKIRAFVTIIVPGIKAATSLGIGSLRVIFTPGMLIVVSVSFYCTIELIQIRSLLLHLPCGQHSNCAPFLMT